MADFCGNLLITGAGQRIGRALALELAKAGYRIGVHYNQSQNEAKSLVDAIRAQKGDAFSLQADLSDSDSIAPLMARAAEHFGGPVTHLINNASLFLNDKMGSLSVANWHKHMTVNSLAPLLLTEALAKALPQDQKGAVIHMIDQRVWRLNPAFMTYTASKAALWALTQTSAQALSPRIRVNAIGPGPTLASIHHDPQAFQKEQGKTPLGIGPSPSEIARAALFIFASPSMTGQMIALDGGQHLAWQTPDFVDL